MPGDVYLGLLSNSHQVNKPMWGAKVSSYSAGSCETEPLRS